MLLVVFITYAATPSEAATATPISIIVVTAPDMALTFLLEGGSDDVFTDSNFGRCF